MKLTKKKTKKNKQTREVDLGFLDSLSKETLSLKHKKTNFNESG